MLSAPATVGAADESGGSEQAVEGLDEVTALVRAAACGDKSAWDRLVDRFAGTVWAVARSYRVSPSDAADISQTTWLRLVENLDRIQQPDRVGAWLATTARRESLRVLRLSGRQIPNGDDMEVLPDSRQPVSSEHSLVVTQRAALVAGLVGQLAPRSAQLLRMLSADPPLSYKEISQSLDMPVGSIGPTRARALERLKKLALQAGLDPEDILP